MWRFDLTLSASSNCQQTGGVGNPKLAAEIHENENNSQPEKEVNKLEQPQRNDREVFLKILLFIFKFLLGRD